MKTMPTAAATLTTDPTLPTFFLGRLAALADAQATARDPQERVTLSIALFSVFLDCADLGLHDEAQRIMARFHQGSAPTIAVAA